jgi:hypothetical protein
MKKKEHKLLHIGKSGTGNWYRVIRYWKGWQKNPKII